MGEAIVKKYFAREEWEKDLDCKTYELKRMHNYTGMSFEKLLSLPLSAFLYLRRESWIDSFKRSEEGRETLKSIWRLSQTKADLKTARKHEGVVKK